MVCHSCSIYHHHYIDTLVLLIGIYLSFCSGNTLERIRYSIHQHHISNKIHLCLHICHQTWEYSLGCILCSVLYGISNSVASGKNYIWGHILQHNPYILLKSIKDIHQFHKIMKQGYIRMGLYMRHTFHQHNCIRIFLEYSFDQTYNILFNTQCKYPWNHKRDLLCTRAVRMTHRKRLGRAANELGWVASASSAAVMTNERSMRSWQRHYVPDTWQHSRRSVFECWCAENSAGEQWRSRQCLTNNSSINNTTILLLNS